MVLPAGEVNPEIFEVSVSVLDESDDGISGVEVVLIDGEEQYNGTTSSTGVCNISVPAGIYSVEATHTDYEDYTQSDFVVDGNKSLPIVLISE